LIIRNCFFSKVNLSRLLQSPCFVWKRYKYLQSNKKINHLIQRNVALTSSEAEGIENELKLNEAKSPNSKLIDTTDFNIRKSIGNYARLYGRQAAVKKYHCSYNTAKKFEIAIKEFYKLNPGVHIDDINENDIPILVAGKPGRPGYLSPNTVKKDNKTIWCNWWM